MRMSRRIIEGIPGSMASIYEKATRMVIESYYSKVAEEIMLRLKTGVIFGFGHRARVSSHRDS